MSYFSKNLIAYIVLLVYAENVKKYWIQALLLFLLSAGVVYWLNSQNDVLVKSIKIFPTPSPTPTPFTKYQLPVTQRKDGYTILFVGDSMTFALGPHPFRFSQVMNENYEQTFAIDNYSIGSISVLSLDQLITTEGAFENNTEPAIIDRDYDILLIESFGHNPLSQFPLEDGLRLQEETLDKAMIRLIDANPDGLIVFVATLSPDEQNYARNTLDLSAELRLGFVKERRAYIENFIAYAKSHNIPLVNMYEMSLNEDGSVKANLISNDNIHPSQEGIEVIQEEIARFIIENGYLK